MKKIITIASLIAMFAVCLSGISSASGIYTTGDRISDFTVTTYDGTEVNLYSLLEEKEMVLINIWATWCGPCRSEFPFMQEAYAQYSDSVGIIALSCEPTDTNDVLADFAADLGITFNIARDEAGLSSRFSTGSIPTTAVVDRFGTVCLVISGALPDAESFIRIFDAFTGDDYTESTLYSTLPPKKPDVVPSTEAELAAALNAENGALEFTNSENGSIWPMTVTETDGRSVVAAANTGVDGSESVVTAVVNASAGDAAEITFKVSCDIIGDAMQLRINGETVKSFSGIRDWMTYAYEFPESGEYEVSVAYIKAPSGLIDHYGEYAADTLWVDSIAHLTGDAAAAALAKNPIYPISDDISITPATEGARRIIIDDPTGNIASYYGDLFYLIPAETADFELTMTNDYDPETTLVMLNYDSSIRTLANCLDDGRYLLSAGIDSTETTGYCNSTIFINPDIYSNDATVALTYFRSEANIDILLSQLAIDSGGSMVGSWRYADEDAAASPLRSEEPSQSDYIIRYTDQNGNAVPGVMCQVCDESTCQVFVSDENGECRFTLAPYEWEIHTLMLPEGYDGDTETITIAPAEGGVIEFTLTLN